MYHDFLIIIITLLSLLSLVSLAMNIKVVKILMMHKENGPIELLSDSIIPDVEGVNYATLNPIYLGKQNKPVVLLFLATNCPKCKSKLSKIEKLIQHIHAEELQVLIALHESNIEVDQFTHGHELANNIIHLSLDDYLRLNAHQISPAYLFINEESEIEGQGMIGDEDWNFFASQILS